MVERLPYLFVSLKTSNLRAYIRSVGNARNGNKTVSLGNRGGVSVVSVDFGRADERIRDGASRLLQCGRSINKFE